jgi:lysophospholipase L1-like esterase
MPKPDGRIRIMCLGDSITFGNAVNVEDSYPKILERKLKQFHPNCEVISAAVCAWDTYEEADFLKQEGIKYQPDILILGFYINDFAMRHKKMISIEGRVDARPRWLQWLPYKYIYLFKRSALITFLRLRIFNMLYGEKDFGTSLLRNEVDLNNDSRINQTYSYILDIKHSCDENKVKLILISIPPINFFWLPEGSIQYPGHLKNFCKSHEIIYFDIADHFVREKSPNTLYLYPWDFHLSPRGHASIAEYLATELEKQSICN